MAKLCRAHRLVDTPQNLRNQLGTKYVLWIFVTAFLAFSAGESVVFAGQRTKNPRQSRIRFEGRIPSPKSDLTGTLAGLKIIGVGPNSVAARSGLRYGDVLIAYNKHPITNEEELDAVIRFFQQQFDQTGRQVTADISLYRDGDMSLRTFRVLIGRLGIYTREWTLAGAFVQDAIVARNDYASAAKYVDQAAASGLYTEDQILHMRILCLNNEKDGQKIRAAQVDELYRKYEPEKLRFFANYDLIYYKRHHAGAAIFERYLKLKGPDAATELTLASCYTEIEKYDEAEVLLAKVLARPRTDENAASEYTLSRLSNIQARIYLGRRQYDRAQTSFKKALERYPDDLYYPLAFLYCAARREAAGEKAVDFESAYEAVSERLDETEDVMGYHVDALRAFVLMKRQRISAARAAVLKWKDSADARRYIPVFWRNFPDGTEIISNWNLLMGQQEFASRRDSTETSKQPADRQLHFRASRRLKKSIVSVVTSGPMPCGLSG
jgi:tetratricopeptide (TPR) repeat protein